MGHPCPSRPLFESVSRRQLLDLALGPRHDRSAYDTHYRHKVVRGTRSQDRRPTTSPRRTRDDGHCLRSEGSPWGFEDHSEGLPDRSGLFVGTASVVSSVQDEGRKSRGPSQRSQPLGCPAPHTLPRGTSGRVSGCGVVGPERRTVRGISHLSFTCSQASFACGDGVPPSSLESPQGCPTRTEPRLAPHVPSCPHVPRSLNCEPIVLYLCRL